MVTALDVYKEIRRLQLEGVTSQRQVAKQLGISRNSVKKYWNGESVPREKKEYTRATTVLTDDVLRFIGSCLDEDDAEHVKKQIDWGEATVYLNGKKTTVNLFCARMCYSCAPFVIAYRRQNPESFLDALIRTFKYFGGVTRNVIFDNAGVAVKSGFGAHAAAQDDYSQLVAHYGFQPVFCNPASGNEKGLVENLVGYIRRNVCVPLPHVTSLEELNGKPLPWQKAGVIGSAALSSHFSAKRQSNPLCKEGFYPRYISYRCISGRDRNGVACSPTNKYYSGSKLEKEVRDVISAMVTIPEFTALISKKVDRETDAELLKKKKESIEAEHSKYGSNLLQTEKRLADLDTDDKH